MESTGTAAAAEIKRDYISAFSKAVALFGSPEVAGDAFAHIPALMVADFGAVRSELWLWDTSSNSAYLTNAAGAEASRVRDYTTPDSVAGRVCESRNAIVNEALGSGKEDREFRTHTAITHVSAYPLISKGDFVGVCANYSRGKVDAELLKWWDLSAQLAASTLRQLLSDREKSKTITQLSLLFEATRLLNSTLDLAELLELILRIARTEVKAERGTVFLVDAKNEQVWSIVAQGLDHQEIRVPFGNGVAGKVAVTGEIINVEDAYSLDYFERSFDQRTGFHTKSLLCVPIRHADGHIVGVIQLLNHMEHGKFSEDEVEFLLKLSGHMAMALENARLHREALEKQRLERELEMARGIQRSLLPDGPPVIPGYDLSVVNEPCYEVGGDYYDFLSLGPQTLLLVIADVEGKGVSSALVMSNLQATLRALVMHLHSLEVLALSLNEMMYNDTKSRKYLSIFLGLVDTRRNGLHYINAGHVPPLLINGETGKYKLLQDGGTVVGLFPTAEYARGSARLNAGDILVAVTDGITEACNPNDDEFGAERLAAEVAKHRHKSADQIIESVMSEVRAFARGGVHIDDKVLMVLKVTKDRGLDVAKGELRRSN